MLVNACNGFKLQPNQKSVFSTQKGRSSTSFKSIDAVKLVEGFAKRKIIPLIRTFEFYAGRELLGMVGPINAWTTGAKNILRRMSGIDKKLLERGMAAISSFEGAFKEKLPPIPKETYSILPIQRKNSFNSKNLLGNPALDIGSDLYKKLIREANYSGLDIERLVPLGTNIIFPNQGGKEVQYLQRTLEKINDNGQTVDDIVKRYEPPIKDFFDGLRIIEENPPTKWLETLIEDLEISTKKLLENQSV